MLFNRLVTIFLITGLSVMTTFYCAGEHSREIGEHSREKGLIKEYDRQADQRQRMLIEIDVMNKIENCSDDLIYFGDGWVGTEFYGPVFNMGVNPCD